MGIWLGPIIRGINTSITTGVVVAVGVRNGVIEVLAPDDVPLARCSSRKAMLSYYP